MRRRTAQWTLILLALAACFFMFYFSTLANETPLVVSPQGCEMSWMSPHYVLQTDFDKSWTPFAKRYSLWLYREVGIDNMKERNGEPVLFIPGNAGSSRQVRSIASSAARQFYENRRGRFDKPLDVYAVEFNEDFSAIHPPTLLTQARYSTQAVHYILSLYPKGTRITIIGHSMGGTVAQILLKDLSDEVLRAVITMSTPSQLAPVRFDRRSEGVYKSIRDAQLGNINSTTPLISICGGATDSQITSELCAIPERTSPHRRTIMTSSLHGAWTGVGHREMVWCHQVRMMTARLALDIAQPSFDMKNIHRLMRSTSVQTSPPKELVNITGVPLHFKRTSSKLEIGSPMAGVHFLPLPTEKAVRLTVFSHGIELQNLARENGQLLTRGGILRVLFCTRPPPGVLEPGCVEIEGRASLLPRPNWPGAFPSEKGVLDNDHVSLFEADIQLTSYSTDSHVGLFFERSTSTGWVVAAVEPVLNATSSATLLDAMKPSGISFSLPARSRSLRTIFKLPKLLSHALIVYRGDAVYDGHCLGLRVPPLLLHQVSPIESHYHTPTRPFYLHSHRDGPFLPLIPNTNHTPELTIYSSGECGIKSITLRVAWKETLGRLGVRYWMGLAMWSVAVVALLMLSAIMGYDANGTFPPFEAVMVEFTQKQMLPIGGVLVALSMLPLPKEMIMGNSGILVFAPLSFFMWLFANGLVGASNYILKVVAGFFEQVQRLIGVTGKEQERSTSKRWIASILFVSLLVATIIPFQIAFMIVFIIQFSICCSTPPKIAAESSPKAEDSATSSPTPEGLRKQEIRRAQNFHLLVLLIWLALPFAAPILVVWVRTLQTAGYTVPFDGDHSVIVVLPWLLLGEVTASGRCLERESLNWRKRVTYASFLLLALTALLFGARFPYMVFEMATVVVAWLVATRVRWR